MPSETQVPLYCFIKIGYTVAVNHCHLAYVSVTKAPSCFVTLSMKTILDLIYLGTHI
jgi:hypothetical protein